MTARTVLIGERAVRAAVGSELGTSDWVEITESRLDAFAAATGAPDASLLALGLSNMLLPQIVEVSGFSMGINYGTDAVVFGEPLRPGDRVRASATLVDVADVRDGIQTRMVITLQSDSASSACVIESLSRWLGAQ